MGLIKSVASSISGTLKDTWKDYFVCGINPGELMNRVERRSDGSNKGSDSVITHNSKISVPAGIAMVITNGGQVIEFTADPGEFVFDTGGAPSFIDSGGFFKGIKTMWQETTRRFQYAGESDRNMHVYAINIKEVLGNKFGTPEPVPYEDPVYKNINIKYHGTYNFKVSNVLTFINTLAGTELRTSYKVNDFTDGMREIFMTYLNQEINQLASPYTKLSSSGVEITKRMVSVLEQDWYDSYGILITKVGINAPTLDEKSQARVEKYGDAMFFQDSDMARGHMVTSTAEAMIEAGKNKGGTMIGMTGLNMAEQMGSSLLSSDALKNKGNTSTNTNPNANEWKCECGTTNTSNFCSGCGGKKPIGKEEWACANCGTTNTGNFCSDCGDPKQTTNEWVCNGCGEKNEGKFCSKCGEERK